MYSSDFLYAAFFSNWRLIETFDCSDAAQSGPAGEQIDAGYTFQTGTSGFGADGNAKGLTVAGVLLLEELMQKEWDG